MEKKLHREDFERAANLGEDEGSSGNVRSTFQKYEKNSNGAVDMNWRRAG
jgi:hypothetical protein